MESGEEIRELHEALVPVELSFEEFWCRYVSKRLPDRSLYQAVC